VGKNEELFRKMKYAGIKTKVPKNVPVLKTGTAGPARCSQTALALQEVDTAAPFIPLTSCTHLLEKEKHFPTSSVLNVDVNCPLL